MNRISRPIVLWFAMLSANSVAFGQQQVGAMAFTLSMKQPGLHTYHIVFRCEGLPPGMHDFKMPAWTPGYYGILDFAKNVRKFTAEDGAGKALKWEKTSDNTWRVVSSQAPVITVSYDVLADRQFVANSYLDEKHGYVTPASVFLYIAGQIQHPVTVEIVPPPTWKDVATGLDPVAPDKPHTYSAADFDILYDSPVLIGNLETLPQFEIKGIRHSFTGYEMGAFDREVFTKDLKAVVEQGVAVIGDVPYDHYDFLAIGPGRGGIEHLNSTAFGFRATPNMRTQAGRNSTLSFLAHEYFHHFNVKRIRPIALGPFDYDQANLTNMLWVSEGFTVYYEMLMVARAGLMTQGELLESFRKNIVAYDGNTGHLFQSATQSSYATWKQGPFGGRRGGGIFKTVSYYDKGAVLALLLDFKIRHATKNEKSLDNVMQTLYKDYYQTKQRGWTDDEFRATCETVAGVPLDEIFDYASTTKDIDYAKYLAYAGLELEPADELPQTDFRSVVEDIDGKLIITALELDSAAKRSGIDAQDEIKAMDGKKVDAKTFNQAIVAKKPGDRVKLTITRGNADRDVEVILDHKLKRGFHMKPMAHLDPLQAEILQDWLKKK
jgi:predicted metalloprotease with PDZ domain